MVKNLPAKTGDAGSTPGSGRFPGEGNGNPFQYSFLPGEFHGQRSLVVHRTEEFQGTLLAQRGGGWVVRESFPEGVVLAQRFERGMRIGQAKWSW